METILLASGNVEQIAKVKEHILLFQHLTLNLPKFTLLYKIVKVVRLEIADEIVLNRINIELLVSNTRKKRWV